MSESLIDRLRAMSRFEHDDLSIGDEAADEIERLRALVGRLRHMAKTRRETANGYRAIGGYSYAPICGLESAADAYDRAADELQRALSGECPPAPGYEWLPTNADVTGLAPREDNK